LIANHTCGIDHLLLQATTYRVLGFMIAQEYYDNRLFHPFCKLIRCIPVKRDGRDLSATRAALRALEEGRVVPIFPEGRILPTSGRELGEIKQGAAFLALRAGVPVIPAYIRGTPETNQIGPSLITPSSARVVFGKPVDLSDLQSERNDRAAVVEVSRRFREALLALQNPTQCRTSSAAPVERAEIASAAV
jgi:1-acyl-sn-glycerol-3-phosphate acyltransferase